MGRKTLDVTITEEGRDKGKMFLLTEMPASKAEKWAARLFLALARSGVDIPEDVASGGMAAVAGMGLKMLSAISFEEVEPLLDEMFTCVQFKADPKNPLLVRPLREEDIEEVKTRIKLRAEVFTLHTGFSWADVSSISESQADQPALSVIPTSRAS